MPAKILLIILTITFYSCGTKNTQVEASFGQILEISKNGPLVFFKELITEDSKKYINGLIELSDSLNYEKAAKFGNEYGNMYQLTTMKLHGELMKYVPEINAESPDSAFFSMVFLMKFTGTGILGNSDRIRLKEVAKVRGNEADVKVRIRAEGNTNILTTYKFKKEDQIWKLNLMSTFSTDEKLLKQLLIRQGFKGNEATFIADFIENTPEMIEFKYDSSMVK